ncbi:MAG: PolC-type DNA polymerase III [Prevotella sp.]|nr:PolC-type DNA polymerase III [Staphylococcus sp.]MCM1349741.1 PolC-type DNA polymerase III [Prevotella sp.]
MIEQDQQLMEIFIRSGLVLTESLQTGRLDNVIVNDKNKSCRICLSFSEILDAHTVFEMQEKVTTYVKQSVSVDTVKYTISYTEECKQNYKMSQSHLKDYLTEAIRICKEAKKGVIILESYFSKYENNTICFVVATIEDKKNVEENLLLIKQFFLNYGLSFVHFDIEISEEARNLKEIRQKRQQVQESLDETRSVEAYRQKRESMKEEHVQHAFRYKNTGQFMSIQINDIPTNSMEVAEFTQINGTDKVMVLGTLVSSEIRNIKSKQGREFTLVVATITNYTDSVMIKRFIKDTEVTEYKEKLKANTRLEIKGKMIWDDFAKDVVIMCDQIVVLGGDVSRVRYDEALVKRIELHAHTKMSVLDSLMSVEEYVDQAKNYGHKAIAVTDHANCHVLPELFKLCAKKGIKPIAGVEGYYIDEKSLDIAFTKQSIDLKDATYVVFDIETTGLYIPFNEIIEIGAVKIKNGLVIDQFSSLIKPKKPVHQRITDITHITNEMLYDQLPIEEVLPGFLSFIEGSILVAHNAHFDTDFIYAELKKLGLFKGVMPCIDTMMLARGLYGGAFKQNNLRAVGKFLKVEVEPNEQHRAVYDAKTTGNIFVKMLGDLLDAGMDNYDQINTLVAKNELFRYKIPSHINLLVKNKAGLKNFYKIISESHTTYFQKDARMLRSLIEQYRNHILVGSGCANGEIFRLALEKTYDQLVDAMDFYDYIEVQPPCCYMHLFDMWSEEEALQMIQGLIQNIITAAKAKNKLVVATGDVHELLDSDAEFRKVYLSVARPNGGGPHELSHYQGTLDMHYRSTSEMLEAFAFLPSELAYEIVVTNTNIIGDMIESYPLFPDQLYVPRDDFMLDKNGVASMKHAVYDISYQTAYQMYGNPLPQYVQARLDKELDAVIGHGYFSVYYISHLLVKNSNDAGYIVGSRGSVGSSFVATMMGITEVNPLKPHYYCTNPHCHFTAFKFTDAEKKEYRQESVPEIEVELQKVGVGMDLKPMKCPKCGQELNRSGVDIAFETFLGFTGEKVPDIDLNFSGEYQAQAHLFCQKTFGIDNAFRAGTVSTVQSKTAFAYARDYYQKIGVFKRQVELERLSLMLSESKRTTGQHPGGIVVVPDDIEYTDIIPVQYPPVSDGDITGQVWRTSHYDYHKFEDNLLKLDILGHDDPTVMKTLMDYVHANPEDFPFSDVDGIPYYDKKVISLFSSKEALGIENGDVDKLSSGTIGIPEFGTSFVRGMLETIRPDSISQIIKVSGLSHGTDVWMKNAEDLVKGVNPNYPKIMFNDVIGCRDDIMIALIAQGVPAAISFKIMEGVRKGRGLTPDQEDIMRKNSVPEWFIDSCKKIKYLFPKAHATAYVIMALRIAWFKVYRPIYYYAAYFSKRAKEFDPEAFAMGRNAIQNRINEIENKIRERKDVTNKEIDLLDELKIALEMNLRGLRFRHIDVNISEATDLVLSEDKKALYLPFVSVDSLGETVAKSIVEARKQRPFSSRKDFELRTSVNKKQFANLITLEAFGDLVDDDTTLL